MQFWRPAKPKRKSKALLRHHGYEKHLFDKEEVPRLIKLQNPKKSKKNDVFEYIGKRNTHFDDVDKNPFA